MGIKGELWIYGLGFFGQALFGLRLLTQWFFSEREGRPVSPVLYWQISLLASLIVLLYGVLRKDPIIIFGQLASYYIYIRNLQLKERWTTIAAPFRYVLSLLPFIVLGIVFTTMTETLRELVSNVEPANALFVVGALGQVMINIRFIYQWYYSERRGISVLPLGFWIISLIASMLVLIYGIYRRDPVLFVSQCLGLVAYIRNIYFYHRVNVKVAKKSL